MFHYRIAACGGSSRQGSLATALIADGISEHPPLATAIYRSLCASKVHETFQHQTKHLAIPRPRGVVELNRRSGKSERGCFRRLALTLMPPTLYNIEQYRHRAEQSLGSVKPPSPSPHTAPSTPRAVTADNGTMPYCGTNLEPPPQLFTIDLIMAWIE